ncbi:MAG TPA: type II CAAX endopeptidase family protein [Candidatus Binatia bacterium]|nr:type II CAAX endopeptidase family protein [Candidatus Binatia bacterium]
MFAFLSRQRIPARELSNLYPQRELPLLLAYCCFYTLLSGVTAQLILHWPCPLFGSPDFLLDCWYFLFFKIGFLLVLPAIVFRRLGYGTRDLVPGVPGARDYWWSLVAYAIGFGINAAHWTGIQHALHSTGAAQAWMRITAALLIALFNAGIPEEFVFRGWLQTRMEQSLGRLAAILGTALLFTAWHIPSRYFLAFGKEGHAGSLASVLLNTGLPVLIVALVLGLLWDRHRRLLPLIALHWGIDSLPLITAAMGLKR